MIGAFSLSQAGPSLEELGVAAGAMNFIYETIHRVGGASMGHHDDHTHTECTLPVGFIVVQVPPIDSSSDEGTIPDHIEGKVELAVMDTMDTEPETEEALCTKEVTTGT